MFMCLDLITLLLMIKSQTIILCRCFLAKFARCFCFVSMPVLILKIKMGGIMTEIASCSLELHLFLNS